MPGTPRIGGNCAPGRLGHYAVDRTGRVTLLPELLLQRRDRPRAAVRDRRRRALLRPGGAGAPQNQCQECYRWYKRAHCYLSGDDSARPPFMWCRDAGISWEGDMAEGSPIIETTMILGGAALFGLVTAVQQ